MPYTYPLRVPAGEHLDDEHAEHIATYIDKTAGKSKTKELRPHDMLKLLAKQHPDKFSHKPSKDTFKSYRLHRLHHVVHHLKKMGWKKTKQTFGDKTVTVFVKH